MPPQPSPRRRGDTGSRQVGGGAGAQQAAALKAYIDNLRFSTKNAITWKFALSEPAHRVLVVGDATISTSNCVNPKWSGSGLAYYLRCDGLAASVASPSVALLLASPCVAVVAPPIALGAAGMEGVAW